jgi:TonB family protein
MSNSTSCFGQVAIQDSIYSIKDVDVQSAVGTLVSMSTIIVLQTKYPNVKRKERKKGQVTISVTLDKNGDVHNPVIKESLGSVYDHEALRVVELIKSKKWQAATKEGNPVSIQITLPFTFEYKK